MYAATVHICMETMTLTETGLAAFAAAERALFGENATDAMLYYTTSKGTRHFLLIYDDDPFTPTAGKCCNECNAFDTCQTISAAMDGECVACRVVSIKNPAGDEKSCGGIAATSDDSGFRRIKHNHHATGDRADPVPDCV